MQKRVAYFGDVHGALDQLKLLYGMLQHYSLDAIEHCGDLIDRGPDSGGVVQFCREHNISGVLGNHESVILQYPTKTGNMPKNPDKLRSIESLNQDPRNMEYIRALPYHKFNGKLLHTHAGMSQFQPLDRQRIMWCIASMIHPDHPDRVQWMEKTRKGVPESVLRESGWVRWYEVYKHEFDMVVGHRCLNTEDGKAGVHKCDHGPTIHFVDTGAWFHKNLTALIYPDNIYVSTKLGEYRL
jgi:hypothetical protein